MIEEIRGEVSTIGEKSIVVLNGGIGLNVWTTPGAISALQVGDKVHLYTCLILRETDISLYGFPGIRARDMFKTLIKVNGIGPKAAISILSTMSVEEIYHAVNTKDYKNFNSVPGIGNKTSQKLVLYLQDALETSSVFFEPSAISSINTNLLEALVGLGYSVVEAQTCIQNIPDDSPEDLESRLRLALQYFS